MNIDAKFLDKVLANLDNQQSSEKDVSGSHRRDSLWDPWHVACSISFWCAFLGLGLGLGPGDRDLVTFYWMFLGQAKLPGEGGQGGFLSSMSPGLCGLVPDTGVSLQASCWGHPQPAQALRNFLQQKDVLPTAASVIWTPFVHEESTFYPPLLLEWKKVNK